jgi:hypothetical protein
MPFWHFPLFFGKSVPFNSIQAGCAFRAEPSTGWRFRAAAFGRAFFLLECICISCGGGRPWCREAFLISAELGTGQDGRRRPSARRTLPSVWTLPRDGIGRLLFAGF